MILAADFHTKFNREIQCYSREHSKVIANRQQE